MNIGRWPPPPRGPERNGLVERANRPHRTEHWERYAGDLELPLLQAARCAWEAEDTRRRPHQAAGYLTPPRPSPPAPERR